MTKKTATNPPANASVKEMLDAIQKLTREVHVLERSLYLSYIFTESVYELAFGDNAMERGYTDKEVIDQVRQFATDSMQDEEKTLSQEEIAALLTPASGGMFA